MMANSTTTGAALLTSTTAPGKMFASRQELAEHYKSDWHKYNLKRREAGLPLLGEEDFQARLEAAMALRRERASKQERSGKDHLKNKEEEEHDSTGGKKKKNKKNKKKGGYKLGNGVDNLASVKSPIEAYERMKEDAKEKETDGDEANVESTAATKDEETETSPQQEEEEETDKKQQQQQSPPEINPYQCLFDKHISSSLQANIDRMHRKYGFFIPDQEYLVDLEGLLGYCQEKVRLGHYCLYCQRVFSTWHGCQKHMISTRHTKLRYERGFDLEEYDPFYDFEAADAEYLGRNRKKNDDKPEEFAGVESDDVVDDGGDDDDGWEDISDDEEGATEQVVEDNDGPSAEGEDEDDGLYAGYQDEIAKFGFDVTPLGELVFPDGRIVGHRGLKRYYKQRFRPDQDSEAVVAARSAAGERLYRGRVYNMGGTPTGSASETNGGSNALALARAGAGGFVTQGRVGSGILVKSPGGSGFTAVSLYRYKAVVKKARRDEARGQRLQFKSTQNINRMDKKANRLMNGVSVAHAAR